MTTARRGYTLFEVLLVLAILVLLAALVAPSLEAMYGDYKVTAAVDAVRGAWAQARAEAMDKGVAYRFALVPGGANYRIAPDTPDYWSGGDPPLALDPENAPVVLEDALPAGVRFTTAAAGFADQGTAALPVGGVPPTMWVTTAVFLPEGSPLDDAEVVF